MQQIELSHSEVLDGDLVVPLLAAGMAGRLFARPAGHVHQQMEVVVDDHLRVLQ